MIKLTNLVFRMGNNKAITAPGTVYNWKRKSWIAHWLSDGALSNINWNKVVKWQGFNKKIPVLKKIF